MQGQEGPGLVPGSMLLNTSTLSWPGGAREGDQGTRRKTSPTPCPSVCLAEAPTTRACLEETQALKYRFQAARVRLHPFQIPTLRPKPQGPTSPPHSCVLPLTSWNWNIEARCPLGFTFANANQAKTKQVFNRKYKRNWKSIHCGKTWCVASCPLPMLTPHPAQFSPLQATGDAQRRLQAREAAQVVQEGEENSVHLQVPPGPRCSR